MSASLFRVVHRLTGLGVAALVVVFVATGIPLQFTDALQLGSNGVQFRWVHAAYGIRVPARAQVSNVVTQVGDIALSGQRSFRVDGDLRGALQVESMMVVATSSQLVLIPADADAPVETIPFTYLVDRFGATLEREIAVQTAHGVLMSKDFGASWQTRDAASVRWFEVSDVPTTDAQAQRFGAAHVAWERWLQDLHSGRFFGPIGVWVMTIAGVALLVLSVTGLIVWLSSRNSDRTIREQG